MVNKFPKAAYICIALLLPFVTGGIQWLLWEYIEPYVWFLFFPTIFFSSRIGGKHAGIISTIVSAVLVEYIFIPPHYTLAGKDPHNLLTVVIFLFMGTIFGYTHERLNNARLAEQKAQEENSALREQFQNALIDQLKSERQQARDELHSNRARLEAALASMDDALYVSDTEGQCIHFNDAFATFHKFRSKDECARNLAAYPELLEVYLPDGTLVPPEHWAVPRALRGESATSAEFILRRRDTDETWVGCYNFAPIRNTDGAIVGTVVTARDITDRKEAEKTLFAERTMLRTLIDTIPDLMWLKDPDGVYLACNPEFEKFFGAAEADIVGKTDYDYVDSSLADFFRENDQRAIAAGRPSTNDEWVTYASDGKKRFLAVIKTPMFAQDGSLIGVLGIARDITALKQAEEELARKNDYMEQFLYTTSHDMRTPLVTVKTFLGFLENDISEGNWKQYSHDLKFIHQAADKMKQLLDRLQDLSRINLAKTDPLKVTLSEILAEASESLAGTIEASRAEIHFPETDVILYGSREHLCVVWQNLIENAIIHGRDGCVPAVRLGVRQDESETIFSVQDNGIGIEPRYLNRVFMMFEKLEPQSPGAGLGLTITKYVIENEGGRIWAESSGDGTGSCFCFTLPRAVIT